MKKQSKKYKSVLTMDAKEAREFFLDSQSFCKILLPSYFQFAPLIANVFNTLGNKKLEDIMKKETSPSNIEGVNHVLLTNKDGRHTWRKTEIVHPVLYAHLVREITKKDNWQFILNRFSCFQGQRLRCLSIPKKSLSKESNCAESVSYWWNHFEQRSIELALQYECMVKTDISNCYDSIYTHSIAWALHGKEEAKKKRAAKTLLGNIVDKDIRYMRNGQTNGIPLGSILLDFIVEMVLGYADILLLDRIEKHSPKIKGYEILRYVDDYRIFIEKEEEGAVILKLLTETLFGLGLNLSAAKTKFSREIIHDSIKPDKIVWGHGIDTSKNLQKNLLIIHGHAKIFPNSGTVEKALSLVLEDMESKENNISDRALMNPETLISIIVDIAFHNPRTQPICFALLGRILNLQVTHEKDKISIISKIQRKFSLMPNIGHMEIWLQRITLPEKIGNKNDYAEALCKVAKAVKHGESVDSVLWNNDWIKDGTLKKAIDEKKIIDEEEIGKVNGDIPYEEVALFSNNQY